VGRLRAVEVVRMEFTLNGRGLEVTPDLRDYVDRRLRRLERHLGHDATGLIELTRSGARSADERLAVQVSISSDGALLRTEQHAAEPRSAIDAAVDVLDRQIGRVKGRWSKRGRAPLGQALGEAFAATDEAEATLPEEEAEYLGNVVKTKEFKVQPLAVDEAAEHMELLGHDFYVFLNTATGRLGVVYRRRDGDYGLLDPLTP